MKKIFTLIFILSIFILNSQVEWENEVAIRQGTNIEWYRSAASIPDGSVVYVWSDTRNGGRDVFAQKVDSEGNPLWGDDANLPEFPDVKTGITINNNENRQEDIVVIETGDSQVIAAWIDFRNGVDGDVYAQKIDESGNLLWESEGVPVCLNSSTQISLNIVSDEAGGAYILWNDGRGAGIDIYGTHINGNGNLEEGWQNDGNVLASGSGDQYSHTFWEDGNNGAVLFYVDATNEADPNIFGQRILPDGTLDWGDYKVVCDAEGEQSRPKVGKTTDGKFIVSWRDKRTDSQGDIRAQKIDLNGDFLWDNEVEVSVLESSIQRNARLTATSDDGAIVIWEDGRNSNDTKDLFAQKINSDGSTAWTDNGIEVSILEDDQLNPRLISDGNGGVWVIYDDVHENGFPNVDIYLQHIENDGSLAFGSEGKNICNMPAEQFSPMLRKSNDNLFACWGNGNSESGAKDILVQIFDSNGNEQLAENGARIFHGLVGDAINYQIIENYDNPIILWSDTRNSGINQIYMQILNSDGSTVLNANGVSITEFSGKKQEQFDSFIDREDEIILTSWSRNVDGYNKTYLAANTFTGERLFGDYGILLSETNESQKYQKISKLDDGNYLVVWTEDNVTLKMQKVGQDGSLFWGSEGKVLVEALETGNNRLNDVIDNKIIWTYEENWLNSDIKIIKINNDGSIANDWPEEGVEVCEIESVKQSDPISLKTPEGIAIFFTDMRNGDSDIYGQLIDENGNRLWNDDGKVVISETNDQFLRNIVYNNGITAVWSDFRTGLVNDVYMQKMDLDGNKLLDENGFPVTATDYDEVTPNIVTGGTEVTCFWKSVVDESSSDLYAQSFDIEFNPYWASSGLVVCDANNNQSSPEAVDNAAGKTYLIWKDERSSGKSDIYGIYSQKVAFENESNDDNGINSLVSLKQNYPNPFNISNSERNSVTRIDFTLDRKQHVSLDVFNLKGQKVRTIMNREIKKGKTQAFWDGKNSNDRKVSSGVYLYRLKTESGTESKKMLLIK